MKPTLISIFGLPVRSYGLMLVIGFTLAVLRAVKVARERGWQADRIYDLSLTALLSGVLGARLVFVLINPLTEDLSRFFKFWEGGLSFHGGLLFAVLAIYFHCRIIKVEFLEFADLVAPSVAIAYGVTRLGCFLNGCCYGAPTNMPWGCVFSGHGVTTPPSHPTQIYSAIASFAVFGILARASIKPRKPGFVLTLYIGLYGVYRFIVEFFRAGYSANYMLLGLTEAQVVSIAMTAASVIVLVFYYRENTVAAPTPARKTSKT